jgi:hypothetical protein
MRGPRGRLAPVLLLALLPFSLGALEVYVAPLAVLDDTGAGEALASRPEADLLRELRSERTGDCLSFLGSEEAAGPASLLEAAMLCERQGYSCLLYGYVKRSAVALSAELKLLDHESGRLAAVFFGGDDPAHYDRLMRDMAAKVREYFFSELGLPPPEPVRPRRNRLELAGWLAYWTPLGGEWGRVIAGIAAVGLGARLIPANPGYLAFVLEAEYGLGMNEPDYESFFLHAARLRIAAEAALDLPGGHAVGLGTGLLVELDSAVQDRKYASLFTGTSLAPGVCLSLLYRYRLSSRLTLGAAGLLEVAGYSPVLVTFSPRVFVAFRKGDDDE